MGQVEMVYQTAQGFLAQIVAFMPRLLGAILILVIGWLIAKFLAFVVVRGLRLMRFDVVTSKAGVDGFLKEGGTKKTTIDILGVLVYWFVILITLLTTFNVLGLGVVAELFNRIALYVPKVIVAVLILAIGLYFARLVAEAVTTYARNVGMADAELMGRLSRYAIMAFVIIVTLQQVEVDASILNNAFLILIASLGLGLALAFGLGGQKWAAGALERFMAERGRKK